ncbi:pilus assembly protein N-terminal domain-containing protein [Bosea sp. (in: a-proteobacteria)]|uniref:pilus assembly protein N-terminal domain-containing protein n=1 Tax=Bosea sp. (in: a-proteobacteria) TaxID=1871050 RepID=UPI002FC75389
MSIAMTASRPVLVAAVAAGALAVTLGLALSSAPASAQTRPAPAAVAAPAEAGPDTVIVNVDHAKVVRLPEKAQTVIVGNPAIADVTVQRNGVMVVTGKSFGVTNLIALDASGTLLAESFVRVRAATDSVLTVQRGLERESYSCAPVCQPTARLGDVKRFFDEVGGQASARNAAASGEKK